MIALGAGVRRRHGLLVARLRLQPFIVTLCGLLLYRGAARYIADDSTKGFGTGEGFEWAANAGAGNVGGVPMPFVIMVVVAAVAWVLVHRSVRTAPVRRRHNEEAARYSGREHAARHRLGLRHLRRAGRGVGRHHRLLHQLDLAGVARQLLRALCDCRRRRRRLQPARRRGLRCSGS